MKYTFVFVVLACVSLVTTVRAGDAPEYGKGFDLYTTSSAAVLSGNTLFVTWPARDGNRLRHLISIDVSDPSAPRLLDRLETDGFPMDVALRASRAYVVNGRDLLTVDISDPSAMQRRHSLRISDDPMRGPQGIVVDGKVAWLACRRGGIQAIDVTDPDSPKALGGADAPAFLRGLAIRNDRLYAAADTRGVFVFDVSDPAAPALLHRMPAPEGCIGRIQRHGENAFLAGGNTLVAGLSLANPDRPEWMGATQDRGLMSPFYGSYAHNLAIQTRICSETQADLSLAVVADGESGLVLADVSRPEAPRFLGAVLSQGLGGAYVATGLALKDNTVFLIDQFYGLRVIDISDHTNPIPVGEGLDL